VRVVAVRVSTGDGVVVLVLHVDGQAVHELRIVGVVLLPRAAVHEAGIVGIAEVAGEPAALHKAVVVRVAAEVAQTALHEAVVIRVEAPP